MLFIDWVIVYVYPPCFYSFDDACVDRCIQNLEQSYTVTTIYNSYLIQQPRIRRGQARRGLQGFYPQISIIAISMLCDCLLSRSWEHQFYECFARTSVPYALVFCLVPIKSVSINHCQSGSKEIYSKVIV